MSAEHQVYRVPSEETVDVYDWDIVMTHGTVRVMGMSHAHVRGCVAEQFGAKCTCCDGPRTSSPIVCAGTRRVLEESWYSNEPTTGQARHLLLVGPGCKVTVKSGKVYRLVGPRKREGYDGFASGSIFHVYPKEDRVLEARRPVPFWRRLFRRKKAA